MIQRMLIVILAFLYVLLTPSQILASQSYSNNRFGVHITNIDDVADAAKLVNSNGGAWGYVTFVIREDERNTQTIDALFDELESKRLIPIVRVATKQTENGWNTPDVAGIKAWAEFFDELNWPTQKRIIVVGNEPNHAKEWGGSIDPQGYAAYLRQFSIELKSRSGDYYILPAGLDASAPNDSAHLDQELFMKWMLTYDPHIYDHVDGWNSHSYPNPGFSGSETDTGRGTVAGYAWELDSLKYLGVSKQLPIFITETGWLHSAGGRYSWRLSDNEIAGKMKYAFENVWTDDRIMAVTPFILSYTSAPFDGFSMKNADGSFNEIYTAIKSLSKIKGSPYLNYDSNMTAVYDCFEDQSSFAMTPNPLAQNPCRAIAAKVW